MATTSPMFFPEERGPSRLARLRQRHGGELAVALTMLFVWFGVRRPKTIQEVYEKVMQVPGMVRNASRDGLAMVRSASQDMLNRYQRSGASTPHSFEEVGLPNEEPPPTLAAQLAERLAPPAPPTLAERVAEMLAGRMDSLLVSFIGYKLVLLLLYTMPNNYFFGVKEKFLTWASKAPLFRLLMSVAPYVSAALAVSTVVAVRWLKRPPSQKVVSHWQWQSLLNVLLTYSTTRLFELIRGDPTPMLKVEETAMERDMLAREPPSLGFMQTIVTPFRKLAPDVWFGIEELPQPLKGDEVPRRLLFVGNHMIWALDVLQFLTGIYEKTGIYPRAIGEHSWFAIPGVGEIVSTLGAIDGNRHNCGMLMEQGANLLVYPGGLREAWKTPTDEKHSLIWPDRHVGFAAMAVRHGYTIVPVATVGMEDIIGSMYDVNMQALSTLGGLIEASKGASKAFEVDSAPVPWMTGRAQRIYYRLMPPINLEAHIGRDADVELVRSVRDQTKSALQAGIAQLLAFRETDPDRFVFAEGTEVSALEAVAASRRLASSRL